MTDRLTASLIERYGSACVPRYTSYPTAPHFSAEINEADYRSWLAVLPEGADASLYVHVPFCRAMCWYCGCHTTVAAREAPVTRYVASLLDEIRLVASHASRPISVSHLHFGGGTPTMMRPDQMRALMAELRARFVFRDSAEVAIGIDPRTLSPGMAAALGTSGFNRASLGVQSFDRAVQRAINRVQSFEETKSAVDRLRASGIARINFDLIYGLPLQSIESCIDTVQMALRLMPDRIAVFGYAHVPFFKKHQRRIEASSLADGEERWAQARAIADALVAASYVEIGLDHFALPDDPLALAAARGTLRRNFQGYTTDQAELLIGLGASAIGRMPMGYVQNVVAIPEYQRRVENGRLPIARGYRFNGEDCLRAALIERLMCDRRVDVGALCRTFSVDAASLLAHAKLEPFIADGLLERQGTSIAVKPHAFPLVRSIAAAFDAHLSTAGDHHSRAI